MRRGVDMGSSQSGGFTTEARRHGGGVGEKRDWRRRRGASFVSFVVFVVRDSVRSGNENALPRGQGGCLLAAYDPVALPADLRDNNGAGDRNREGHGTDMVAGVGERSNVRGFAVARA